MEHTPLDYEDAFSLLKMKYIRRLENSLRVIDHILYMGESFPLSKADLLRAQSLVHVLSGSGATFGFPAITDAGRAADHFLESLIKNLDSDQPVTEMEIAAFVGVMNELKGMCILPCQDTFLDGTALASDVLKKAGKEERDGVLVIDDNVGTSASLTEALEHRGLNAFIAESWEDAMACLTRKSVSAVIVNLALSGVGGVEVFLRIRQNAEFMDIPVILITEQPDPDAEKRAVVAGVQHFIVAPFDFDGISRAVEALIPAA